MCCKTFRANIQIEYGTDKKKKKKPTDYMFLLRDSRKSLIAIYKIYIIYRNAYYFFFFFFPPLLCYIDFNYVLRLQIIIMLTQIAAGR